MSETPSMLVLTCTCGQKMKIPEDALGRTFKCVRCGVHMKSGDQNVEGTVPAPSPSPATPSPATDSEVPAVANSPRVVEPPDAQSPIGQMLIDAKIITEAQLADALSKQQIQGGKTFEILIALGYLDKDVLHDFLSQQAGIATLDLSRFDIGSDLIALVPKKMAVECLVLPIDRLGKLLTVAMACPLDVATISALEASTGLRVKAMLCKLEDIHAAVQKYYPERSRYEMSPSSFDTILGKSEGTKEKVEPKVGVWDGIFPDKARLQTISEAIRSETGLDKVARLLLEEPVLAAFFIRVANSDLYGMPGQVESLPMAVAVIGKGGVGTFLEKYVVPGDEKVNLALDPLIAQCRTMARVAQNLAREGGSCGEHLACTVGLLGGLGQIALASISPMKYKRVKAHLYGSELSDAELRLFSMDHAAAAGAIIERWRFPATITKAVRHCNNPKEAADGESLARLLALTIAICSGPKDKLDEIVAGQAESMKALNLDKAALSRALSSGSATMTPKGDGA